MSKTPPQRPAPKADSEAAPDYAASNLTPEQKKTLRCKVSAGKAERYLQISDQIKPLEAEKAKLSSILKEDASTLGTIETGGTATLDVDGFIIKSVASVTTTLDEKKALAVLTSTGLIDRCTKKAIDPKEIEICFQEGLLDALQVESMLVKAPGVARVSVKRK